MASDQGADGQASTAREMICSPISTMIGDRSRPIPPRRIGGRTLRIGPSTGSVSAYSTRATEAIGVPGVIGNQLRITRAKMMMTYACMTQAMTVLVLTCLRAEQAALLQALSLLSRYLDVRRCEQEHLVGNLLHRSAECVGEPTAEIDHAARQVAVHDL